MIAHEDEYARVLGKAAIGVWADMSRDVQEALFELATAGNEDLRTSLAKFLHDRHPRTQHPPKPEAS
jgi:hypothetical protein